MTLTKKEIEELKIKYPEAWAEVMSNPLGLLWGSMEDSRKEEILKGIDGNMRLKNGS